MITISLCMIVKDEEKVIKRCLDSVIDVVDEIIIVDTGSNDSTKEIAKEYTQKIYDFKWIDDFSKARDFSFSKATKEYILWLDADEILDYVNKNKLLELKGNLNTGIDVVTMETYMCLDENNNPTIKSRRNRIVKSNKNFKWTGYIHEYIEIDGNIYDSDIGIIHHKVKCVNDRNLKIYKRNIDLGNELSNRDLCYYGKELYCNCMIDEAIKIFDKVILKDICKEEKIDALCKIGECYLYKKETSKARKYFYKTFEYIEPRGEVLYNIAYSFEEEKKYYQAIFWYEMILNIKISKDCSQCMNIACWRFKPHLNLSFCYFELNNLPKAYYHHEKAKQINPLNKYVMANDEYFKSIIKK